jgi:uncharacterized membrane-anchored protein YhcB (DUF1043 family)
MQTPVSPSFGASGRREVHQPSVIFFSAPAGGYSPNTGMNLVQDTVEFLRARWWLALAVSSVVGIAAVSLRLSESEASRAKRIQEAKRKELRALADRISKYAKSLRDRFPEGAVVVSEEDLAAQLRKRPDYIVSALNALLNEQKVQRTPLTGYWRLNA